MPFPACLMYQFQMSSSRYTTLENRRWDSLMEQKVFEKKLNSAEISKGFLWHVKGLQTKIFSLRPASNRGCTKKVFVAIRCKRQSLLAVSVTVQRNKLEKHFKWRRIYKLGRRFTILLIIRNGLITL